VGWVAGLKGAGVGGIVFDLEEGGGEERRGEGEEVEGNEEYFVEGAEEEEDRLGGIVLVGDL
jgi:hypothetical protein